MMTISTRSSWLAVILIVITSALAPAGRSQGRSGRPDPMQRELQRQVERELIENALKESPSPRAQRLPPPVLAQIRDDFLRIQVVARKLMQATSQNKTLNPEFVTRSTDEIRGRAVRLKKNLALPETDSTVRSKEEVDTGTMPIGLALSLLSRRVDQLVSNPMFKEARLADIELSAQALRDMEAIIELSGALKRRSAEAPTVQKPARGPELGLHSPGI